MNEPVADRRTGPLQLVAIAMLGTVFVLACSSQRPGPEAHATGTPASPIAKATASAAASNLIIPTAAIGNLAGRIAFTRAGGVYGDETVFVANVDGSSEQRLGEPGHSGGPFALRNGSLLSRAGRAPDGRFTVVFSAFDGSNERLFPLPGGDLHFGAGPLSPDGRRTVLEGFRGHDVRADPNTYIADVDGSHLKILVKQHFLPADFSPDGKQVLLFQNEIGLEPPPPGSLWVVNVDGSGLHRLTAAGTEVQCCFNYRWSPDGTKILFASPGGVLLTVAPDGSDVTPVFRDPAGGYAITPTWSPDGSMIMFALDPKFAPIPFTHPPNGLYVVRADGSDLTLVLGSNDFKREPFWVLP